MQHGKHNMLEFQDDELVKLKAVFDTLDTDGSGAIGVEELVDPFLALGIADSL